MILAHRVLSTRYRPPPSFHISSEALNQSPRPAWQSIFTAQFLHPRANPSDGI